MANIISWIKGRNNTDTLAELFRLALIDNHAEDRVCRAVFTKCINGILTKEEVAQVDELHKRCAAAGELRSQSGSDDLRAAKIKQSQSIAATVAAGGDAPPPVDLELQFAQNRESARMVMDAAGKEACALYLKVAPRALEAVEALIVKEREQDAKRAEELGFEPVPSAVVNGLARVANRIKLEQKKIEANPLRAASPYSLFCMFGAGPDLPPPPKRAPAPKAPEPEPARPAPTQAEKMKAKELAKLELAREGKLNLSTQS